jgi:hypothetical protein
MSVASKRERIEVPIKKTDDLDRNGPPPSSHQNVARKCPEFDGTKLEMAGRGGAATTSLERAILRLFWSRRCASQHGIDATMWITEDEQEP